MAPKAPAPASGDQPHNNMQPCLTFYFTIVASARRPAPAIDGLDVRPTAGQCQELIRTIYASTREDELAVVEWPDSQKKGFTDWQSDQQEARYRRHLPAGRTAARPVPHRIGSLRQQGVARPAQDH